MKKLLTLIIIISSFASAQFYEIEYEMKLAALKEYMEDPLRDPSKLRDYMTKLHVEKEMKYHMQTHLLCKLLPLSCHLCQVLSWLKMAL